MVYLKLLATAGDRLIKTARRKSFVLHAVWGGDGAAGTVEPYRNAADASEHPRYRWWCCRRTSDRIVGGMVRVAPADNALNARCDRLKASGAY